VNFFKVQSLGKVNLIFEDTQISLKQSLW